MEKTDNVTSVTNVRSVPDVSPCHKMSQKCHSEDSNITVKRPESTVYNLAAEIKNYVECSIGSFTLQDINSYLGLDRTQATNRNKVISRLCKENILIRIGNGVYERSIEDIAGVSLKNISTDHFDIVLPLGLSEIVNVPRKSIIIVAGTSNAGKTLFALETIKLNLHQDYDLAYFFSEMGIGEYVSRVKRTCNYDEVMFNRWDDKVFSGERANGFAPVIAAKCANGLGIIDYLEPPDGDYSRMTHEITRIYDRMETGVTLINLQKGTDLDYAKGGEGTKDKSRLFISMQQVKDTDGGSMVAVKVIKAKESKNENITNKEIHVLMSIRGEMVPLSDWIRVKNSDDRKRLFDLYDTESDGDRKVRMLKPVPSLRGVSY